MRLHIRKLVNWLSLAFFLIAIYCLMQGKIMPFFGYSLLAIIIFLPRITYRRLGLHTHFSNELLDWGEIIFSFTVSLSAVGYLWLFTKLYDYDTYVHFFTTLLISILIAALISTLVDYLNLERIKKSDIVLGTLVIVMSLLLLWELFEFFITTVFHKNMFFVATQPNDTLYDVIAGVLSFPFSSVIIFKYHDWFIDQIKKIRK